MHFTIKNIGKILEAKFVGNNKKNDVTNISIDSRSLQNNSKTLFFALVGPNHDAHKYIATEIEKGVCNFVVNHVPENLELKANFLVVENTTKALQTFASSRFFKELTI